MGSASIISRLPQTVRQNFRPDRASRRARSRPDRFAPPAAVAFRPVLTAAARDAMPILRPGRRNSTASRTEKRAKEVTLWNSSALLCGWVTMLRIKRRLFLQQDTSQTKQSIGYTSQRTAVRVAALA